MRMHCLVALSAAIVAMPLLAQITPPPAVLIVRQSEGYRGAVLSTMQKYESSLRAHCPTVVPDWAAARIRLYPPVSLDDKGLLLNATWVETVPGTACGQHRSYNAITLIRNGRPGVQALLPGDSNASPTLQHDSFMYIGAAVASAKVARDCHPDVVDTHLLTPGPIATGTPWDERWLVDACGSNLYVFMHYVPDATGTTIKVSPNETTTAP